MNRFNDDRGQSMAEAALAFSLLLLIAFAIIEGSRLLYTYHYLAYAARQGSRYAMVRGAACDSSNGMPDCPLSAPDSSQVQTYIRSMSFMGIDTSQTNVAVGW